MKCPTDGTTLVMTERQGVEIDYCPQCRGVWLDRGELDKIIERAVPPVPLAEPVRAPRPEPVRDAPREDRREAFRRRDYDDDDDDRRGYRQKKRGGFLSEIFDFD